MCICGKLLTEGRCTPGISRSEAPDIRCQIKKKKKKKKEKKKKLKAMVFKTLYRWMVALKGSHFSNFLEFLDLCSSSFPYLGVFRVYSMCTWLCSLVLSNKIELLMKESKFCHVV
jgi:hypothetical protein